MATKQTIEALYKRYLNNDISRGELEEFLAFLVSSEDGEVISSLMESTWNEMFEIEVIPQEAPVRTMYERTSPKRTWYRVAAAIAILILLSVSGYLYFNNNKTNKQVQENIATRFKNDVAPGGNKAILTLTNGRQIILDSVAIGTLSQQGNTKVIKLDSGQLAYEASKASSSGGGLEEAGFNPIITPKGGQYQLTLSDGSKVWLNAASSLRYPTSFTGKERNVELTGEGYFEIAHNAKMPFHVKVNETQVEVLGTHFNINAYSDEATIKTTLLEGSVKVSSNISGVTLKPGEQALLAAAGEIKVLGNIDVGEVMAWKDGKFIFNNADIQAIMRQVARWYDVDVEYKGDIRRHFVADVSRDVAVSKLLKLLELTERVHFTIDGKKITVMP